MSVSPARASTSQPPTLADRLMRILPLLASFPASHLPLLGEWMKQASHERETTDRLRALLRARRRAEADIRTTFERLAAEFDVPGHEVDDAMAYVSDSIEDLTWGIEGELKHRLEHPDRHEEFR